MLPVTQVTTVNLPLTVTVSSEVSLSIELTPLLCQIEVLALGCQIFLIILWSRFAYAS